MKLLRQYPTYEDYIKHQSSKTSNPKVINALKRKYNSRVQKFVGRVKDIKLPQGSRILCTGARLGQEVEAWRSLGMRPTGIDIVPFGTTVEHGDFHRLQYGANTFDCYFSTSMDHSNNVELFLSEARRVLKDNGLLVLDTTLDMDGAYEVNHFDSVKEIEEFIIKSGFQLVSSLPVEKPYRFYKGEEWQLIFKKE